MLSVLLIGCAVFATIVRAEAQGIGDGETRLLYKGAVGFEVWHFPQEPKDDQQVDNVGTIDAFTELTLKFPNNIDLRFRPELILDLDDTDFKQDGVAFYGNGRSRIRIDDLYLDWFGELAEIRAGYQIFSWEKVESYNWADFLNQLDREVDITDPDKIAEPAVRIRLIPPTELEQYVELYYFPYFTPARYPRTGNRYDLFAGRRCAVGSSPDYAAYGLFPDYSVPIVQSNESGDMVYGSDQGRGRNQFAARYQALLMDDIDISLYVFNGYERSPRFEPKNDPSMVLPVSMGGEERLIMVHHYDIVTKSGFTFQGNRGPWLYKGESLYQHYENEIFTQTGKSVKNYYAFTVGFEYTFYGPIFENQDLGLILEWIECSDAGKELVIYPNNLFCGLRYTFNDQTSRSILLGGYLNYRDHENLIRLEFSQRMGEKFTLDIEGVLIDADDDTLLGQFNQASRIGGKVTWHF